MIQSNESLSDYCTRVACAAKSASQAMALVTTAAKDRWLTQSAEQLRAECDRLLEANAADVAAAAGYGLTAAQVDRLRLDEQRIEALAEALDQIAQLPDPIGETIDSVQRPNGLVIDRIRVPLGVVFFIYESRPNVTADAAAICVKSGNAVILRGGKESMHSSRAIVSILHNVAQSVGLPPDAIHLVETTDRDAVDHFLSLNDCIDLAIPRGGEGLIRRVAAAATMPVIKHFSGNCHVYIDAAADLELAESITINAKCQRMGVCNAAESLLVHADVADTFLPRMAARLGEQGIELRGDERACQLVSNISRASEDDFGTEFLGPIMSVAVVANVAEAIRHINRFGSGHTDAIVSRNEAAIEAFANGVDTAAVIINASTRFHDGGEFGLGAEIGISTDKFHARGPCGLRELTSYKYVVRGDGQIRQ